MQLKFLQMKRVLRTAQLVLLLSVAGMGEGYAYDFSSICSSGQTLYYNITDAANHYVELTYPGTAFNFQYWTGFTEPTGDIVLLESVSYQGINYSVTSIGDCAFAYCDGLTGSLTIPNSVTTIGDIAFRHCSGFSGSLTIPNSVTTIGSGAFMDCSGFTGNLVIPENVISIGGSTFLNCNGFTGDLSIPNSVTTIGELAFCGCSGFTGSLTIPNSVTSIGFYAFSNCNGFSEVHYNATNCSDFSTNGYSTYPFSGCGGSLTIGDNVERIPANLFGNGDFTGSLIIGNSVVTIGNSAFNGCANLTSVLIPNSVTEIGSSAFRDCINLTSVNIGNSVTHIGSNAFGGTGWYALHPEGVLYLGNWCLGYKGVPVGSVALDGNTRGIADVAFYDCGMFSGSLTIPNSVVTIGINAFSGCGFNGLNINMTDIPDSAFENCDSFTGDLIIGNSVTTIGDDAFRECDGFNGNLTIGNSVTSIGDGAFQGCSGFTGDLTIPYHVTEIGDGAFSDCSGFTGCLTISNSLSGFDDSPFSGCNGLKTISISDSVEAIEEKMFYGLENLTSVSIGKSVKYIGEKAFGENPRLNMIYYNVEVDLDSDDDVFYNCPNLTTIHIGADVKEIGSDIFKGCNTVHFVVALGPTPAVLDAGAFSDIVDNSVLMVSCGKRVTYYSVWNMFPFNNIIEDCNEYLISIGVVGTGGNVTSSITNAQMGQTVTITVTPNPGMMLSSISVVNANDPTQIIPITPMGKAASNYSFVMPPFEVAVMATFKSSGTSVVENSSVEASVYPNPTAGHVKIEAEDLKQITISNMLGRQIYNGKVNGDAFEYDFGKHGTGLYLIRIETASGVVVKKVSVR